MNLYLGITDTNWYNYLRQAASEDINFWQPGGNSSFKVLERGAQLPGNGPCRFSKRPILNHTQNLDHMRLITGFFYGQTCINYLMRVI